MCLKNVAKLSQSLALVLVLVCCGCLSSFGQTSKGILAGVVKDGTGAVVPNAVLTIKGEQTGETRNLTSGSDGSYRAEALSPEVYTVSASSQGFSTFRAEHILVAPSVVTTYNITFSVGSRSDVVTVEADAQTINTDNGQLAGTISSREITVLPVFTLNPLELSSTVPGVQTVTGANQLSNGVNLQVDGARPRSNNFLLDSQEINDIGIGGQAFQPNIPDLYQDVTVITSAASAEYGRSGGGVFNLVTKGGTNTFHGTAYDRYTGSGINAVPNILRGTGQRNGRFDEHIIGGTVGGYIIKDKLFAFGGTQFSRVYGTEQIGPITVPDAAGVATLNSLTGSAATQVALLNKYTTNNFYLSQYQLVPGKPTIPVNVGTQPGCATNPCIVEESQFQRPPSPQKQPDTQWSYRIDFKPHERDTFYVRYLHDRSSLTPDFFANAAGGALGLDTNQGGPSELGAGSWTHIFTPNVLNEVRASETRINFLFSPTPTTLANPAYALPTLNISQYPTLGPIQNFPQGRAQDLYQIQDTFSLNHGRHSIRAGFDIGHQLEKDTLAINAKGTATFARGSTGVTALGNFLNNQLGPSGTVTRTTGRLRTDPHVWRSGFFAQDDVKLSPQLTVNLGVRYDYTGNPENSLAFPGVDLNNPYQSITTVIPVKNDKNNISPRIGFAFSPNSGGFFGSGKTVVRGGFGIFYDSYFSNFVTNAATTAPNATAGTLTQTSGTGLTNAIATLNSFTPTLTNLASETSVASNLVNPQTYQYNLGVEQDVKGAILAVRYVGARGEKLFASNQLNYFNGAGSRLNTTRGVINVRGNFASSNYNGLQVEGSKRFRNNLTIRANYTFSKGLDNGSEIFALSDSGSQYGANLASNGRTQEYGPSAFDHRHYVSIAYVWAPAGFHVANRVADTFVGALTRNWTLSGVEQFQSGAYGSFTISPLDTNGDGSAVNDRPILGNPGAPLATAGIDGSFVGGTPGVYYDIGANNVSGSLVPVTASQVHFLVPAGNSLLHSEVGRNSFSNPGSTRNDIALQKGFGLGLLHLERGQLLFRVEAQNIGNHNDRGSYLDTDVLDFGPPTSLTDQALARGDTSNPSELGRQLVLYAKFAF
jgi:outer membrane receptor protein involved in Fe transport